MTREHFEKDQEKFRGAVGGSTVSTPTLRIIEEPWPPEPPKPEPPPEEEVPKEEVPKEE